MNQTEPGPFAVDVKGAARLLSVSERTIETLLHSGKLPRRKLGRRTLIRVKDVEALLRSDTPTLPAGPQRAGREQ